MPRENAYINPSMVNIQKNIKGMLRYEYNIRPSKIGRHRTYPLKLNQTWTFEQDFIWTELSKYPQCNDIDDGDNPEIQFNIGKEEFQNALFDIDLIQPASHIMNLPHPMYIKKGTVVNFSTISITDPDDVRILLGGFHPVRKTSYNPVVYGHPYLKVARWTGVTASTRQAPVVLNFEDWEDFTATHVVAMARRNYAQLERLVISNDTVNLQVELSGKDLIRREVQCYSWCGTPAFPRVLDPPLRNITGTQIVVNMRPPAWGDSDERKLYILFWGIMKYRLDLLPKRFPGTVDKFVDENDVEDKFID